MAKDKKKGKQQKTAREETNPETQEQNRLKSLAYSNGILSEAAPAKGFNPLSPSKTVIKHHGKDILKKSQRKNRFLLSFPGLLAPLSGGKIGDLTDLGSKNPVLYLDFPQGRMKLLGTIVYPKNRYLTLQFSRGGKNVVCDDCFDIMIVFSDACWVGKKEENPDEARLDLPKELYEGKHPEVDFQGGAGATAMKNADAKKVVMQSAEDESSPESPLDDMDSQSPERPNNQIDLTNSTPVRQSRRTAGKKFNFAEDSSGDDSAKSVSDMSGEENEEAAKSSKFGPLDQDHDIPGTTMHMQTSEEIQPLTKPNSEQESALPKSGTKESCRGSLFQATISTLFKKVEVKNTAGAAKKTVSHKVSDEKMQRKSSKLKSKNVKIQAVACTELTKVENNSGDRRKGARNDREKQKAKVTEDDDDIEEFSSASEENSGSDEDWRV